MATSPLTSPARRRVSAFCPTPSVPLWRSVGKTLLATAPAERAHLFRTRLLTLGLFAVVIRWLAEAPDEPRSGTATRKLLAEQLPHQPTDDLFKTLVGWGRYGQLFDYEAASDELSLFAGRTEAPTT